MVLWIIGLSGAGKTTLANEVVARLRKNDLKVVLLDGDIIRNLFKNDVDHTIEGRRRNAERISVLSKFLADEGIHIVAAVLSIFPEWQDWNRKNIPDYTEVYLKVSLDTLVKREIKNLYKEALKGELKNVVGVDIPFPEPLQADLTIDNESDRGDMGEFVDRILKLNTVKKVIPK
jgi:adenylylsulfate kinase-like enzyme